MSEDPTAITVSLLPDAPELGEKRQGGARLSPERARLLRLLYEDTEQTPECTWQMALLIGLGYIAFFAVAAMILFTLWYVIMHSEKTDAN